MRCPVRRLFICLTLTLSLFLAGRLLVDRGYRLPVIVINGNDNVVSRNHAVYSHYNLPTDTSVYTAGMYMTGQQPGNETFCKWYHGLPDRLTYLPSEVSWSPEAGKKSPYRVLPFVLRGDDAKEGVPEITLCTHATADQVYGIVELARRWEGPLSLAIFAPGLDAGLAVALLDRACRCETAMSKVSIHLIFPTNRPPALGKIDEAVNGDCAASDLQWKEMETERRKKCMTYPINVARNVARMEANTIRVLVSDIELLPSEKLASGFLKMIHGRSPKIGVVFVLPVFEIEANEQPPSTKRELLAAVKVGLAVYFHRFLCLHCQRFPGLTRWMTRPDPGKIKPLMVTHREYPHHRWEPVFIGTRDDPLYTENMSWEGKQDKMAQMFEMCLLNYRLVILDGAFLIHMPGIKRKSQKINIAKQEYFRPHERRNAVLYQRVIKRLLKKYPKKHKCA